MAQLSTTMSQAHRATAFHCKSNTVLESINQTNLRNTVPWQFKTILFSSGTEIQPNVNLSSPGNKTPVTDLQSIHTDQKIQVIKTDRIYMLISWNFHMYTVVLNDYHVYSKKVLELPERVYKVQNDRIER